MTRWVMEGLNTGTSEDFVRSLLKKYKPINILIRKTGDDCVAVIEFSDENSARRAQENFKDKKNKVVPYAEKAGEIFDSRIVVEGGRDTALPYGFIRRKAAAQCDPDRRHDALANAAWDVAFEVVWRAETPVAANPCTGGGPKSMPEGDDDKFGGYANRWLMLDGRLALSPFTVKSAVANGVAALLGGCCRVMRDKLAGHKDTLTEGSYPYDGEYKRYRVAMDNSKPGILRKLDRASGEVEIERVTEYYYDDNPPAGMTFERGKTYYANAIVEKHRLIIRTADDISDKQKPGRAPVIYVGPYRFGMDLTLGPGQFGKAHRHRFYCRAKGTISGRIGTINLEGLETQKKKVHMGIFRKLEKGARDPRPDGDVVGKPWHQELNFDLDHPERVDENWVYYQEFDEKVVAIGRNFQFKTAFRHTDAVPDGQQACTDIHRLCPRCALFGMVDGTKNSDRDAAGFKGRFKSATLVSTEKLVEASCPGEVPVDRGRRQAVNLGQWKDGGGAVASQQFLLPIQSSPKPNKRDKGGYYRDGMTAGVKQYRHAAMTMKSLEALIKTTDQQTTLPGSGKDGKELPYTHEMRRYAQVCREGIAFHGTLGAENCSAEELAALLLVLDDRFARHGFKIGLGKAFGLGSMSSRIARIWVRRPGAYAWEAHDLVTESDSEPALPPSLKKAEQEMNALKKVEQSLASLDHGVGGLKYKAPGKDYWTDFEENGREKTVGGKSEHRPGPSSKGWKPSGHSPQARR